MMTKRTDLATESRELFHEQYRKEPDGVDLEQTQENGIALTRIHVRNETGAKALDKPVGTYITAELREHWERDDGDLTAAAELLGHELASLLPEKPENVLVVGLGNRHITADSLGPLATEKVIVTRHLKQQMPEAFEGFSNISAISPGVLGLTGMETGEIVQGVCEKTHPSAIIAIDALASRKVSRLCRTIQLADTGITPGSGIAGGRSALDREHLQVPVIAIGVPTVVDAYTLAADLCEQSGTVLHAENCLPGDCTMVVTPKDIDLLMRKSAKVIGYAINIALHGGLSIPEMEELLA
ncbi:GPR endopeptidase [Acidaminobacterium chupaoyuni]